MAKDPATLWYWNDWHSGTILFSRFLKGCYMDLLHAQFNNGRLSLEEIKTCLGPDFGSSWPTLQKKFKQDENGLFFNERAENEKNKRAAYSESRRKNRTEKTYDDTYDKHMKPHMENENRNKDETVIINSFGKCENLLTEIEIGSTIEFVSITANKTLEITEVEDYWKAFLIHSEKEKHQSKGDKLQHFRSWLKIQIQTKKDGNKSITHSPKTAGAYTLLEKVRTASAGRKTNT